MARKKDTEQQPTAAAAADAQAQASTDTASATTDESAAIAPPELKGQKIALLRHPNVTSIGLEVGDEVVIFQPREDGLFEVEAEQVGLLMPHGFVRAE